MPDRNFFLSPKASKARLREAEQARKNRWEILKAQSQGQVSRRDLIKMGLFTQRRPDAPNKQRSYRLPLVPN